MWIMGVGQLNLQSLKHANENKLLCLFERIFGSFPDGLDSSVFFPGN